MRRNLVAGLAVVLLLAFVYFAGRWQGKAAAGVDAAIAEIKLELADTTAKLQAARAELADSSSRLEVRVDTLIRVRTRTVELADMWSGEAEATAGQLRAHLVAAGDTVGVSVLDALEDQHHEEAVSLRRALAISDSLLFSKDAIIGNMKADSTLAEERYLAALRAQDGLHDQIAVLQRELHPSFAKRLLKEVPVIVVTAAACIFLCPSVGGS